MTGTGITLEVKIDDKAVLRAFNDLQNRMANTKPIMQAIGTGLVGTVQKRLGDGSLAGRWAPLNPTYRAGKKNKNMLVESGSLRGSISEQAGQDYVKVGTNKVYAAIHQFGGTIHAKDAPALFFKMGSGFIRPKSVTIPARPFLTIEREDEQMIADIVFRFLQLSK